MYTNFDSERIERLPHTILVKSEEVDRGKWVQVRKDLRDETCWVYMWKELEAVTPEEARAELKRLLTPGMRLYVRLYPSRRIAGKEQVSLGFSIIVNKEREIDDQKYTVPELTPVEGLVIKALSGTDALIITDKVVPDIIRIHDESYLYILMRHLESVLDQSIHWERL